MLKAMAHLQANIKRFGVLLPSLHEVLKRRRVIAFFSFNHTQRMQCPEIFGFKRRELLKEIERFPPGIQRPGRVAQARVGANVTWLKFQDATKATFSLIEITQVAA